MEGLPHVGGNPGPGGFAARLSGQERRTTYDADYVKNKILVQSLINSLGTDFVDAAKWLKSLDKLEHIKSAFEERWAEENTSITQALADANDLTATILS